jgi:hypothetical protein
MAARPAHLGDFSQPHHLRSEIRNNDMNTEYTKRSKSGLLRKSLLACACASSLLLTSAYGQGQKPGAIFYILLENRNFTAGTDTSGGAVLFGNAAAPYLNSLITPGHPNAAQTAWCPAYHSVLATPSGANPSIHPSEPNYLWMEAGSNFGVLNDNDPYGSGKQVQNIANFLAANPTVTYQHISGLLQSAGISWKSYQEGIDHVNTTGGNANLGGALTNAVLPQSQWTVPLASFSGTNAAYTNPYNGSHQWNFATKHDGSLFFLDTNGSTVTTANTSPSNPSAQNYAPLEQLAIDLANNTVAQYNVITPDQYNDMHTALSGGFTYNGIHYTGDLAQIAQGDNFLSIIVPQIMASDAYKNNGVIVIWTDETEGSNRDDFKHTLAEIVISPLAKGNAYVSNLNYTHSSDLNTLQKIYQVTANTPTGYLNDAAKASNSSGASTGVGFGTGTAFDLSDLFLPNVIPASIPTTRIAASPYVINRRTNTITQTVTVTNLLSVPITDPVYLAVDNLSSNTTLTNRVGTTQNNAPLDSAYVVVSASGLGAGASATATLQFSLPASGGISDTLRVITSSAHP